MSEVVCWFFFFQAEDGIRYLTVTGVQACALPICYRIYSEPDLKRLLFVRQAKSLGFSLDEIRDILRMRERGHCPCGEVITIAERHLRAVEQQLHNLSKFRDGLSRAVKQWKKSCSQTLSADAICALIERMLDSCKPASHGRKPAEYA